MESGHSEILRLPGGAALVEWRRSRRARRVSLRIDPRGGAVVVTLPPRTGRTAGMALLMDHADWVVERLAALPGHIPFEPGSLVPLHGVDHRIRHVGGRGAVRLEFGKSWSPASPNSWPAASPTSCAPRPASGCPPWSPKRPRPPTFTRAASP